MTDKSWEYMHAAASLGKPNNVSFFEDKYERLYRGVDLDTIGTHGWELVSVVMVPNEEGQLRYEYFFKRLRKGESVTIYEKDN